MPTLITPALRRSVDRGRTAILNISSLDFVIHDEGGEFRRSDPRHVLLGKSLRFFGCYVCKYFITPGCHSLSPTSS
ncbi:hypothetical protein [Novipirellula galeiformis]|nr:hypothetical protein [Novipirellula galeiformis]